MSDESVKDQLVCAFLDGELSSQQIDELLEQLECERTRSRACRQAMMGSLMNQRKAMCVDVSVAVREAIRLEAPLVAPVRGSRVIRMMRKAPGRWRSVASQRWQVPAAGLALAASAALAAVIVIQPDVQAPKLGNEMLAATSNDAGAVPVASAQPLASQMPAARAAQVPTQLVATASTNSPASHRNQATSPRELVIASPQEPRPIVAQWSHAQTADATAQQAAAQARMQERLNTYLINHARSGGGYALSGSLGYARVAARPQQTASNE